MIQYNYPKITGGYRCHNLLQRCLAEVGVMPAETGDMCVGDGDVTFVRFETELTEQQKTALDVLMADNPQNPPTWGYQTVIRDLWEDFEEFKQACGMPDMRLYYKEAVPGSGRIDRLVLFNPEPYDQEKVKQEFIKFFLGA